MRNLNGGTGGSDGCVRQHPGAGCHPDLDKSFSTPDPVTGVSTLPITLTNTSDLATKLGWAATDSLATGLVVADPASASATCTNGTVSASLGPAPSRSRATSPGRGAPHVVHVQRVDVVPAVPTAQGAAAQPFPELREQSHPMWSGSTCLAAALSPRSRLSPGSSCQGDHGDAGDRRRRHHRLLGHVDEHRRIRLRAQSPATLTDDFELRVLDDATCNGDAASTSGSPPTSAAPDLVWSRPLGFQALRSRSTTPWR